MRVSAEPRVETTRSPEISWVRVRTQRVAEIVAKRRERDVHDDGTRLKTTEEKRSEEKATQQRQPPACRCGSAGVSFSFTSTTGAACKQTHAQIRKEEKIKDMTIRKRKPLHCKQLNHKAQTQAEA